MNFAIVDRHGFFRTSTKVRSTHGTAEAAVRVAKRDRVSIPGGPKIQSAAMVITCADGDLACQRAGRSDMRGACDGSGRLGRASLRACSRTDGAGRVLVGFRWLGRHAAHG